MIEVKNLIFKINRPILRDISLSIKESVAIIGHNGSGKTTLVKHFNGLLKPSSGKILVDSMDSEKFDWKIKQKVGLLFQNPDDQLIMSKVKEDIAFGLENLGISQKQMHAKVKNILNILNISALANENVNELSFGQKQLVALAGVLVMEPKYLILDEPFSMLDPKNKANLTRILKSLHKKGTIIILVSNNLQDLGIASQVIVLKQGKLIFQGKKLTKGILKKADLDD